jgi:hypothetical protein
LINSIPSILLSKNLNNLLQDLNDREIQQSLPQPFGIRLIDDIQKKGECICGTEVIKGSYPYKKLEEMREYAATGQHTQRIHNLRVLITAYLSDSDSYSLSMDSIFSAIDELESEISNLDLEINRIHNKMNDIPDTEVQRLKLKKEESTRLYEKCISDIGITESKISEKEKVLGQFRLEHGKLVQKFEQNSELMRKKRVFEKLSTYASIKYRELEDTVLDSLEKEISSVLHKYLTKHFYVKFNKETYATKIFDSDNRSVYLSKGEESVLKFAVIAAIVGLAGSKTKIGKIKWITNPVVAPLILDAPFADVDSLYKASISQNLAEQASQLILLIDSSKWDQTMSDLLSEKIGKYYYFIAKAKGEKKEILKTVSIKNNLYNLNEYQSARNETICVEV